MKGFVCGMCGFVSINGSAPDSCPVCFASKDKFSESEQALKTKDDESGLNEKHTPVVKVVKECGLIPEGCNDVHVRVGETIHPMEEDHFITSIDFYLDQEFLARVQLTSVNLNPAAALHVKAQSGKLSVVEHCNKHGAWIEETYL